MSRTPGRVATLLLAAALPLTVGAAAPPCVEVRPGALQAALATAPAGSELCLAPGEYRGPFVVDRPLHLRGGRDVVLRSSGRGSTVRLEAPGARLSGVTIDGSGGRFDHLDAAVRVRADDVAVRDVHIRHALFGILVEQARRVAIEDNEISGDPEQTLGLRGDAIRIWEVRDSVLRGNRIRDARDLVVWYAPGNRIEDNEVTGGRYGAHFMYSHDNVVRGNRFDRNVVGLFVMYSRNLVVHDNVFARSAGAAGVGLGAKESGGLDVRDNRFAANQVGVYLDTSPLDPADQNRFVANEFRLGDTAVVFHGVAARNHFEANRFRDHRRLVQVEGRGHAREAVWRGNDYDDYRGYDLDGDGIGDVPFELRSLSGELVARTPALAFFRGSPALGLVELVGQVVPLFRATTLLVDPTPRVAGAGRRE